jgi:hypothetical protein
MAVRDQDKGMKEIMAQMTKLSHLKVKVGIVSGSSQEMVDIAVKNELGVAGPPMSQHGEGHWFIPPRPFVKGFADAKRDQIAQLMETLTGQVADGTLTADQAMARLGQFGESGIQSFMEAGDFTPNADFTIRMKGSSKPLIDTGALKRSVRYEVVDAGSITETEE